MSSTRFFSSGAIARGHVIRLNKNSYLAVLKVYQGDDKHDSFELSALDPHHAKSRAEELCESLGIHLEFHIDKSVKSDFYDDLFGGNEQIVSRPEFYRKRRVA